MAERTDAYHAFALARTARRTTQAIAKGIKARGEAMDAPDRLYVTTLEAAVDVLRSIEGARKREYELARALEEK